MNQKVVLTIILVVIIGFAAGYGIGISTVDVSLYHAQITEYERQITQLQTRVSELQTNLTNSETLNEQLYSEIQRLEQQLDLQILGIYFSPRGGCENAILYWITCANTSIQILIYSFTLDSIRDALITAYDRGVDIQIVFEDQQISQYSEYQPLKDYGIKVRIDTNSKLMHHKFMIVDATILCTGSFNWSNNGENYNNENLIIIDDSYTADIYENEFLDIWNSSI